MIANSITLDGSFGHQICNSANALALPAGKYGKYLVPLEDTVIASATDEGLTGSATWATRELKQGGTVQGRFTALAITSGTVIVYFANIT
jgi:hypothetical protein